MISATGVRIGWSELPVHVRAAVETILGSPVTAARSQAGGFSPGTADRVETAAGGRAFVKAVGAGLNAQSVEMARAEAHITANLPATAPAPRMLGGFDDGDWVALVLEDIEGRHPRTPWERDELDTTVTALRHLADALTPSPVADLPRSPSSPATRSRLPRLGYGGRHHRRGPRGLGQPRDAPTGRSRRLGGRSPGRVASGGGTRIRRAGDR